MAKPVVDEVERLKQEIINKVSEIALIAKNGPSLQLENAKRENYIGEARSKLSLLNLIATPRKKVAIGDFSEEF